MSRDLLYIFRSRDDLAGDLQADMFSSPPEDQWFSKEKLYKVEQSDLNIEHTLHITYYQVFWPD